MKTYKESIKLSFAFAFAVALFCISGIFSNTTAIGENSSRSEGESGKTFLLKLTEVG